MHATGRVRCTHLHIHMYMHNTLSIYIYIYIYIYICTRMHVDPCVHDTPRIYTDGFHVAWMHTHGEQPQRVHNARTRQCIKQHCNAHTLAFSTFAHTCTQAPIYINTGKPHFLFQHREKHVQVIHETETEHKSIPGSIVQVDEQPSSGNTLPSSHPSPIPLNPSPQMGSQTAPPSLRAYPSRHSHEYQPDSPGRPGIGTHRAVTSHTLRLPCHEQ
jgi:hypothetical protein